MAWSTVQEKYNFPWDAMPSVVEFSEWYAQHAPPGESPEAVLGALICHLEDIAAFAAMKRFTRR